MHDRLIWERDGRDWPNRAASRFVEAGGLLWHVQVMGEGPVLFLVHGTGASTHSWRDLAPILARDFTLVMPDLPGHAFTQRPPPRGKSLPGMSLPGMAASLRALLDALALKPVAAAGHSAGAAILSRMAMDGALDLRCLVSLNGALRQIPGIAGRVFSPLAKMLASTETAARFFAWSADDRMVDRMLGQTGSRLDAEGRDFYARLAANPAHVGAALAMMANWDLASFERDLPRLKTPLLLVVGSNDRTVPPDDAFALRRTMPNVSVECLRGLGHLAHEEKPREVAAIIARAAHGGSSGRG